MNERAKSAIVKTLISLAVIILIAIFGGIIKSIVNVEVVAKDDRFIRIEDYGNFEVYCDRKTKVLYLQSNVGLGNQGYGGITILVNKEGKPLLYGESEE